MGTQTQSACQSRKKCCAVLGDKWMILLFPVITLSLFMLGIIGFWLLNGFIFPWIFG